MTSLFDEHTPAPAEGTPPVVPTAPVVDPTAPLLATIVGEDGQQKYKDVPTALDALKHSQEYIKQLKQQLEEASQKAAQAVTMEQVLAELKAPVTSPAASQGPSAPSGLTATDVVKILQAQEAEKIEKANAAKVAQKFKEVHGEKAEETFYSKASAMGLSAEAINKLAATSPAAVFSMFGITVETTPASPTPSGINTANMQFASLPVKDPVMGFKTDKELVGYWAKLKSEVNESLGIKN